MHNSELPSAVLELIRTSVPTMDALEVLIFLSQHPDRTWTARQLQAEMAPTEVSETSLKETLPALEASGLVEREEKQYRYRPSTPELAQACDGLVLAYNQRPVTLIRTLYAIADSKKIQAFADAFRIRKDS